MKDRLILIDILLQAILSYTCAKLNGSFATRIYQYFKIFERKKLLEHPNLGKGPSKSTDPSFYLKIVQGERNHAFAPFD